jgi:hypothetical protein
VEAGISLYPPWPPLEDEKVNMQASRAIFFLFKKALYKVAMY